MISRTHTISVLIICTLLTASGLVAAQSTTPPPAASHIASPERELAVRLFAAKNDDERAAILKENTSADQNLLAKELQDEAVRQYGKVELDVMDRFARFALKVAERAANDREIARAWYLIGTAQTESPDEINAIKTDAYLKSIAAADRVSADDLIVQTMIRTGEFQETKDKEIEVYKAALPNAERWPDKKVLSNVLGRIGNAYVQKGDYKTGREYHAQSLGIKEKMNDRLGVATTISNLGIIYGSLGDNTTALENFKQSLAILDTLGESPDLIRRKVKDLRNLGIIYEAMGDNAQAIACYAKSLKLSQDGKYKSGAYGALFQLATVYTAQGDYELARQALRRGEGVTSDNQLPLEMLDVLANTYIGEGKYELALSTSLEFLAGTEKKGEQDNLARLLIKIGGIYLSMRDVEKARVYYSRALAISLDINSDVPKQGALLGLAKCDLETKHFDAALDHAGQSEKEFNKLTGVGENWEIYTTIGTAYSGLGKLDLARSNYERAIAIVENGHRQKAERSSEPDESFSRSLAPFHMMVDLLSPTDAAAAFSIAERAKARSLVDALGQGKVNIFGAMSAEERVSEQNLKNDIASLNTQIENEKDAKVQAPGKLARLEKQLADKRLEFGIFQDRIYVEHPELRVKRGELQPITSDGSAALLANEKAAIAEFVVTKDKTFVFVIAKGPAQKTVLKTFIIEVKDKDLAAKVEAYRSKIASGDPNIRVLSSEIYDLLLKPAAELLAGKTDLIIVPDGPLWNLPFQALQGPNGRYVTEQMAVSYAPSMTALKEMAKTAGTRKREANVGLVAFGNPIVRDQTSARIKQVYMGERLEPLPESERLVKELGKMYGPSRSRIFVGDAAREETAKKEAAKYRIVQFATHGILNNISPMYSHLVLARDVNDTNEDGLLEAWEMKDLDLKADMVILSACDTALGKISNGEGVIGMTWAMFIAGAPTTVASQWAVESSSTTELMLEFHRLMLAKKRVSKAEALRRASLKLLKTERYKHPVYWAGFVLVGDGS